MVDITKYPYFSYNKEIEPLMQPIKNAANVQFLNFHRKYPNRERSSIIVNKTHSVDWCASEFYKHSPFERPVIEEVSSYYMWDHLPHNPYSLSILEHDIRHHNIAHGLTIVKKHEDYCDFFVFAARPQNNEVNNFYLNNTLLFETFVSDFYSKMSSTIETVSHHKIYIPANIVNTASTLSLSSRQLDCAVLMTEGYTAKEIGKALSLSHRTVEEYIDNLKVKQKHYDLFPKEINGVCIAMIVESLSKFEISKINEVIGNVIETIK